MGASNHTQNMKLSQFEPGDHPKWLNDYNEDMRKIAEYDDLFKLATLGISNKTQLNADSFDDQSNYLFTSKGGWYNISFRSTKPGEFKIHVGVKSNHAADTFFQLRHLYVSIADAAGAFSTEYLYLPDGLSCAVHLTSTTLQWSDISLCQLNEVLPNV